MRGYTIFISCNLQGITTVPPRGSYWSRWAPGERRRSKLEDALFGLHSCLTAEGWNCRSHFSHQTWEPEKQIESVLAARYISSIQSSATTLKPLADNSMKDTDQRCSTTFQRKTLVLGIHVDVDLGNLLGYDLIQNIDFFFDLLYLLWLKANRWRLPAICYVNSRLPEKVESQFVCHCLNGWLVSNEILLGCFFFSVTIVCFWNFRSVYWRSFELDCLYFILFLKMYNK